MTKKEVREVEDFSSFGLSFQEEVVKAMTFDHLYCDQITEVLETVFFEFEYLRFYVQKLLAYKKQYKVHPSLNIISAILGTSENETDETSYGQAKELLSKFKTEPGLSVDIEYIKDSSIKFCKKQNLKKAMLQSIKLMASSSFEEIEKIIVESLRLGLDNDIGHDLVRDFYARYKTQETRTPISTGWNYIDNLMQGGLGIGEIGLGMAPTGGGKTMMLVHLGAHALKLGKNVLYITLELSESVIGRRFDVCLTKVPPELLFGSQEAVFGDLQSLVKGRLVVKKFRAKAASVQTLRNYVEKTIKRDFKPDLVLIDYLSKIKPVVVKKDGWSETEDIADDLRSMGEDFGFPVWTMDQLNRTGAQAEVATMEHSSGGYGKNFPCDFVMVVSRSPEERQNKAGRMFISKNRFGDDQMVCPVYMDTRVIDINVSAPEEAIEATGPKKASELQASALQAAYNKVKTKKDIN